MSELKKNSQEGNEDYTIELNPKPKYKAEHPEPTEENVKDALANAKAKAEKAKKLSDKLKNPFGRPE